MVNILTDDAFILYPAAANLLNDTVLIKKENKPPTSSSPLSETRGEVTFEDLLVAIGKTRNRDAFIRVFEYFAPRLKSFFIKGGMARDAADELAQETMLTVWRRADTYDPAQSSASTWIYTIGRNKRIDLLRKIARPAPDVNDPLLTPDSALPDEIAALNERGRLLAEAMKDLPEEQAELLRKSFFEEKPHADIAAETGIPLGTVKSRIRLAIGHLRRRMGVKHQNTDYVGTGYESH